MLARIWNKLSNAGVTSDLDPSSSRYIILTNRLGIISGLISLTIFCVLYFGTADFSWKVSNILILLTSFIFFGVILVNNLKFSILSKWLISWLPAILILIISISEKKTQPAGIPLNDYFDDRFLLMTSTIIPVLIFSTREFRYLLINLIPSFIGTVFFDPIHRFFGLGISQKGYTVNDPNFLVTEIIVTISYFGLVGFLLNQRYVFDRFEVKLFEQKNKLQGKNKELNDKNSFINEQNYEMNVQAEKLKVTNEALMVAHQTIEDQKQLLMDQNKNLEAQVLDKTRDLSRVNEELIINNNELRQFSHTLSHNLKSPVATFQGLLNLVEVDNLNSANKEIFNYLNQSVAQMQMVFSDLNEMLSVRNQLYTSTEKVDVQKEIDGLHNNFYPELIRNKIRFKCICNDVKMIKTNGKRLNGILFQLISNAIKFRSDKRIPKIDIKFNGTKEYHSIKVWDNGIGIDLQRFGNKLFYPYQKFHEQATTGKGLGLYLVKLQTESLGGSVRVTSEPEKFTEVEVRLNKY